jgi:hypothetical protein
MRRSLTLALAVVLTGGAVLILSDGANAAAPVIITSATAVDRHAKVTFSIPSGWTPNVIVIATTPDVGSDGTFFTENYADGGILNKGDTEFLSSTALQPGTYYVRIEAYQDDFLDMGWSETASLVVQAPPPPAPSQPSPAPPSPSPAPPSPPPAPVVPPATNHAYTFCLTTGKMLFGQPVFAKAARCRSVASVRMGQVIGVSTVEATDYPALCFKTRTGSRCSLALVTRISKSNVINNRFTVFVKNDGTQTRVYEVLPKR